MHGIQACSKLVTPTLVNMNQRQTSTLQIIRNCQYYYGVRVCVFCERSWGERNKI